MKIIKISFLSLFLIVLGYGVFKGLAKSDLTSLRQIQIEGASVATQKRFENLLTPLNGIPFWKIDVSKIAATLNKDKWAESVKVHRQLPGKLVVSVVERKPVAVVNNGRGSLVFVDESNTVIDEASADEAADYPVLSGMEFVEKIDLRARALALLKELPAEGRLSRSDISDVHYSEDHGFQITLQKTGLEIDLGKENLPLHLDRVRRVVQYLSENGINATRIDSDYAKKVLVKVRKGR